MTNYMAVKNKVENLSPDEGDEYIVKMYNARVLTANELARLDHFILTLRIENGEYD